MKKTLKIFLMSFTLSSFAIWVANELFLSVSPTKTQQIEIPEKNIALFFQKSPDVLPALKTKRVAGTKLATIIPPKAKAIELDDYQDLFKFNHRTKAAAIKISSVEDVADIPLEYGAQPSSFFSRKSEQKQPENKVAERQEAPKEIKQVALTDKHLSGLAKKSAQNVEKNTQIATPEKVKNDSEQREELKLAEKGSVSLQTPENDVDFIPLENNLPAVKNKAIEVVDKAPQTQLAMAGNTISVDTLAIEKNDEKEQPKTREWNAMSDLVTDNNTPWVVAEGNKYAKNMQAVEEFSSVGKEKEIAELLAPKKAEQEGQEVQTAEMVKNILIPIPEDIMNDKNLTPQLVSPKKSSIERESEEDIDVSEGKGSKLLKSITSIFSSSDDKDTNEEDDEDGLVQKSKGKKKKGLFAAFSKDKAATKILPAEMKLSFQPGRAEISGQTLRWIQAFANKAVEEADVILEIRIDKNSSYALQQRRLDLLNTVLSTKGISEDKVNTVFTSREPNSFIIRTLRLNDTKTNKPVRVNQRKKANYQTW